MRYFIYSETCYTARTMNDTVYDLAIIGGGPAGVSAGVYAARKKLRTAFITDEWGGQSTVSDDIQNWIGTPHISGKGLADSLESHLKEYAGDVVTLFPRTRAQSIAAVPIAELQTNPAYAGEKTLFTITTKSGDTVQTLTARTVLLTVGSHRRQLPAKGADLFEHKGLTYCASCDGPLFADRDVVVVGGGNAAFESAAQLLAYCKTVTLINRTDTFRADPVTVEKVTKHANMRVIMNADITEVYGDGFVEGIRYGTVNSEQSTVNGSDQASDGSTVHRSPFTVHSLPTAGVFVEIGLIPNTVFLGGLVPLNEYAQVKIDPWTQKTETTGVWAAGDCTNIKYHQNNIASGDAVRALEDIYSTLRA
jgi:NADH-dependent peroxiredoxin subunit F